MAYTSDYKGPLLVQIYFRKKKDISEEEFHEHWASDHANIALDGLIEHGIINYTQVRDYLIIYSLPALFPRGLELH